MSVAFLFPGQASQKVGMGADLAAEFPEARRVQEEADATLGYKLSALCHEGPADTLGLTEHAQPAILMTSIMVLRVLEAQAAVRPAVLAGHSLGEYTALVAAGALELADALRVVRARGRFMQEAVPVGVGAMAAVIGLDEDAITRLCDEAREGDEVLEPANFNGGSQVVVAGHATAVDRAVELATAHGARLARRLTVSAPFHCPLMAPAARRLAPLLAELPFRSPSVPIVSSVDAAEVANPATMPAHLAAQVERPVRWDRCIEAIVARGCGEALEVGPDSVLSGLVRRMKLGLSTQPVGTAAAVRDLARRESS
jgi:[acyl-carrier-protein] S-malonyltransferase